MFGKQDNSSGFRICLLIDEEVNTGKLKRKSNNSRAILTCTVRSTDRLTTNKIANKRYGGNSSNQSTTRGV